MIHGQFVLVVHVCTHVFQCYFANMELLRNVVLRHTYNRNSDYMTSVGLAQARPNKNYACVVCSLIILMTKALHRRKN